ncbi:MAG TPA: GNAT family N-acetyltransferase [Ktedonobacteraceae bacterium]|nr:GNAT family N-acetyltransferase [Ktedonobacteraceae bacterium]
MHDHEVAHSAVEWRQARPEDAAIWVSVTRRSADQINFEDEDAQIVRYKEEGPETQSQRYLLWRDDTPIGRLRFFSYNSTAELDGLVLLPEAGGRVAAQVVSEALVRSAALGVRHIKATYPAAYIASFAAAGFQELRRRTGMMAPTNVAIPLFPLPASLRVREMPPDEGEQVGTLLQRAYTGGPDNFHPDIAGWRAEVRALQEGRFGPFIPEASFVAEHSLDHYHLAGAILVHMERGVPRIRHMAVAPSFRHVGLGQFLAVKAMRRLHDLGYTTAVLYVTLGIPAVNLYHRLGFMEAGPTYVEAERMIIK